MQTYVNEGYIPSIVDSLANLDPELLRDVKTDLIKAAESHAADNPELGLSPDDNEAFKRLDCVGISSTSPCIEKDCLYEHLTQAFPLADETIDAYSSDKKTLDLIARTISRREKLTLVYDHRGMATAVLGSLCMQYVLLNKEIVETGELSYATTFGTTTKFVDFRGLPMSKALTALGALQFIDYVVPQTLSTYDSPSLLAFQKAFNLASIKNRLRRSMADKDNRIVDVICASASTDKLVPVGSRKAYVLAPAATSFSLLRKANCLPLGLGKNEDGSAAVYTGDLIKPKSIDDIHALMSSTAVGMTAVSDHPSIYIPDPEEYEKIIRSVSRAAA